MNAGPNQASAAGGRRVSRQPVPRDDEAVWYRVPRLTLPIPGVRTRRTRGHGSPRAQGVTIRAARFRYEPGNAIFNND